MTRSKSDKIFAWKQERTPFWTPVMHVACAICQFNHYLLIQCLNFLYKIVEGYSLEFTLYFLNVILPIQS
jgi:hypothetical protein